VNAYRAEAEKQHVAAEGTLESLQAVADERDVLNASLHAISGERDALKEQLGTLQEKIDHIVTTQLAEALKQISSMQSDHEEEVRILKAEVEQKTAESQSELDSVREQNSRLLQDAFSQLEASQHNLSQKQAELDQSVQTLIRVENELKQLEQERTEAEATAQAALRNLESENSEALQRASESHEQRVQELTLKLEEANQNFAGQVQAKDVELHEAERILADSRSALLELQQSYAKLQADSEKSNQAIASESEQKQSDLALEIAKLQATIDENQGQFVSLQQDLSSKIGMVQVLEQALCSLSSKLEEVNFDLKKKSEDIVLLQDNLHRREQDIELLEISKEQLKEQIDRQSSKIELLQGKLSDEERTNAEKSCNIQSLKVVN
jgi:chromosome segregation ATPase